MMDTRDEWLPRRHPPRIYDLEIQISHWFQEQLKGIYADLDKGILSYPLLDTPRYLNNMLETASVQQTTVHTQSSTSTDLQAIKPQEPATRLELQIQALIEVRSTMPDATRKQVHAECQRQRPDLFSIGFEGFKKIWKASNKVG
jgi:hypothetical protein